MIPLPDEILADLRRTLDEVVTPALGDDFAREQARLMSSLLEHLRLRARLEYASLAADSTEIRDTLVALALPPALRDRLSGVQDHARGAVAIELLRAENDELRIILAQAVDELEGAAEHDERALGEIRTLLRHELDRDRAMIGPGYPKGT